MILPFDQITGPLANRLSGDLQDQYEVKRYSLENVRRMAGLL